MIIYSSEMDKFIPPPDFKFKPFDFKNKILYRHPYQYIVFVLYKYHYSIFMEVLEYPDDVEDYNSFFEIYFKLLDRYYRYSIVFEDDNIYDKNKLYLVKCSEYEKKYEEYYDIVRNHYNYKQLVYNDANLINIDELDKGEKNISEIEKWKRKVILNVEDRRNKLNLLDPYIYNSLITFVAFSKFKDRPHNRVAEYFEYGGVDKVNKYDNYKCNYEKKKIYEDRIYNKKYNNKWLNLLN